MKTKLQNLLFFGQKRAKLWSQVAQLKNFTCMHTALTFQNSFRMHTAHVQVCVWIHFCNSQFAELNLQSIYALCIVQGLQLAKLKQTHCYLITACWGQEIFQIKRLFKYRTFKLNLNTFYLILVQILEERSKLHQDYSRKFKNLIFYLKKPTQSACGE